MDNVSVHQLLQYYQTQWLPSMAWSALITWYVLQTLTWKIPYGIVVNVLDRNTVVSVFKLL